MTTWEEEAENYEWPLDEDGNPSARVMETTPDHSRLPEGIILLENLTQVHEFAKRRQAEFLVMRGAIKDGLPWHAFERLKDALDITIAELCGLTGIAQRTLNRRKDQPFTPDESEKILRFGRIYQKALEVLESPAAARRWLKAPRPALGGLTPLVCTDTEAGAREVEGLLHRLEHGAFT
jgi:putative toxin-antitoxin system antitoxin component (TIGR02293 family)